MNTINQSVGTVYKSHDAAVATNNLNTDKTVENAKMQAASAIKEIAHASTPEQLSHGLKGARINAEVLHHHDAQGDAKQVLRDAFNALPRLDGKVVDDNVKSQLNKLLEVGSELKEFEAPKLLGGNGKRGAQFSHDELQTILGQGYREGAGSSAQQPIYENRHGDSYPHVSNTPGDAHVTNIKRHQRKRRQGDNTPGSSRKTDDLHSRTHQRSNSPTERFDRALSTDRNGKLHKPKFSNKPPSRGTPMTEADAFLRREQWTHGAEEGRSITRREKNNDYK